MIEVDLTILKYQVYGSPTTAYLLTYSGALHSTVSTTPKAKSAADFEKQFPLRQHQDNGLNK